ncbi:MAG: GNAT family N-acetyltransferase [Pseudooceanicola sp.]|jgi:ribosomal protein S18 acetylase RimI-like enzyme|nr:GNAT family N-acetyltransferase [Pseudooceanicola sp.]
MTPNLRPARAEDASALGRILFQFQHQHDWMPELYTQDDCEHFCATMIARGWVTVVWSGHDVRGFMARDGAEICALYLAGRSTGRGIGTALIDHAKATETQLWLRCAAANASACRFYRRHGFVEAARSGGESNDENIPDILYVWPREALA